MSWGLGRAPAIRKGVEEITELTQGPRLYVPSSKQMVYVKSELTSNPNKTRKAMRFLLYGNRSFSTVPITSKTTTASLPRDVNPLPPVAGAMLCTN